MNYKKSFGFICSSFFLFTPCLALAALSCPGDPGCSGSTISINNPLGSTNTLADFVSKILSDVVVPVGAIILVIAIIYVGFLFVTAQGKEDKLKDAKKAFFYTIIGGAVLLGATLLADVITNTIGLLK